ncbi:MAG: ankyrin repeat domain-containing protein [Gammaproteobacteria bacterium]
MLPDRLIKIIQEKSLEDRILKKVKKIVEANKQGNLNGIKNKNSLPLESPLSVAASRGFCTILRYLIEETGQRKPNPDQVLYGNQTALGIALSHDQYPAAFYLAQHTQLYPQDIQWGYTALHFAAARNQAEILNIILSKTPDIIDLSSKEGLTAFHLAAEQNAFDAVDTLINYGANLRLRTNQDATAYGMALSLANNRMISRLLDYARAASALEYTHCSIRFSPLKFVMDGLSTSKLPSVIALLEAGAGLDLDIIPKEVWGLLETLGKKRTMSWECLIVGEIKREGNRSPRKEFVTSIADFEGLLNNPNASFKLKQLGISVQHPKVKDLEHVKKIAALVQSKLAEPLPTYERDTQNIDFSEIVNINTRENIKKLVRDDLRLQFEFEKILFKSETKRFIHHLYMIFNVLSKVALEDEENFDAKHIFDSYLRRLHEVLKFVIHKNSIYLHGWDEIRIEFTSAFAYSYAAISTPEFQGYAVKIMSPFVNAIGRIVQTYSQDLRSKQTNLYNAFLDAKICGMLEMARSYLTEANFDLAQTLAEQLIYEGSKIIVNNESLASSVNQTKVQALIILAEVHIHEERFRAAFDCLEAMLEISHLGLYVCRGISHAVNLLLERHSFDMKASLVYLLKEVISYLSNFRLESEGNGFYRHLLKEEQAFLNHFESGLVLLETELLEFRIDALKKQFKLLGALEVDSVENAVIIRLFDSVVHPKNKRQFQVFLNRKSDFINNDNYILRIKNEYLLGDEFEIDIQSLVKILEIEAPQSNITKKLGDSSADLYPQQMIFRVGAERSRRRSVHKVHDCDENREGNNPENSAVTGIQVKLDQVITQLKNLSSEGLEPAEQATEQKIKIKKQGIANPDLDKKRKKFKAEIKVTSDSEEFEVPEGYMKPTPMQGGHLGENQLFVSMPKDNPNFEKFYKLIKGNFIHCISQYGKGQQGVKLGKAAAVDDKGCFKEIPIARLKVCGGETLRAWGFVSQAVRTERGVRKLYLFKPENIVEKKDEYRKGYKM